MLYYQLIIELLDPQDYLQYHRYSVTPHILPICGLSSLKMLAICHSDCKPKFTHFRLENPANVMVAYFLGHSQQLHFGECQFKMLHDEFVNLLYNLLDHK